MKTEEKHKNLRELLTNKILETNSLLKPSKTSLKKMQDKDLVISLFENSIIAEKESWRNDIIKQIKLLNPKIKVSIFKSITDNGLIIRLIKEAQLLYLV